MAGWAGEPREQERKKAAKKTATTGDRARRHSVGTPARKKKCPRRFLGDLSEEGNEAKQPASQTRKAPREEPDARSGAGAGEGSRRMDGAVSQSVSRFPGGT